MPFEKLSRRSLSKIFFSRIFSLSSPLIFYCSLYHILLVGVESECVCVWMERFSRKKKTTRCHMVSLFYASFKIYSLSFFTLSLSLTSHTHSSKILIYGHFINILHLSLSHTSLETAHFPFLTKLTANTNKKRQHGNQDRKAIQIRSKDRIWILW